MNLRAQMMEIFDQLEVGPEARDANSEGKTRGVIYKGEDNFYVAWVFALELKLRKTQLSLCIYKGGKIIFM